MRTFINKTNLFLFAIGTVYLVLGLLTLNNCYFWDVIQQVSREGFWFYKTDFSSLLIPPVNEYGVAATGYHPPLMGMMTAALWKVFGYRLWVSHVFTMFWAALLVYHTWKLLMAFWPKRQVGWMALILLLEPTVLSQYAIASPDFILFTAFVMALRGIIEHKPWLTGVSMFFLCCVNMRGVFVGAALFIVHFHYNYTRNYGCRWWLALRKTIMPYLPTLAVLTIYFTYYFIRRGWFFSNSAYTGHYALPENVMVAVRHLFSLVLRSIENGRIVVWLMVVSLLCRMWRRKERFSPEERMFGLFFLLMYGLYFLFALITQMPFGTRYFMPHFFVLTLLAFSFAMKHCGGRMLKVGIGVLLLAVLTGHFWIYPEKMAKPWDATLSHLPYYELRKECFDYIDEQGLDYAELSSGMCLEGDRGFVELKNAGCSVSGALMESRYVIYSNICNFEDGIIDALHDPEQWIPLKTFKRWPVIITIYKRADEDGVEKKR